jgi:hypothetical protein
MAVARAARTLPVWSDREPRASSGAGATLRSSMFDGEEDPVSTATAEPAPVVSALVQQPDPSVLFIAKRSDLRLVKTGRYPIMVPSTGQRIGETRGVTVAFNNHEFRCQLEGEVTIMDPGGAGQATLPAEELLKFLESHPRCGDPNEGFYRVDPKAPPLGQEEQQRIVDAATAWDVDTLRAIVAQEREGWNREQVIEVAQGAIQRIAEAEERIRASQDERRMEEQLAEQDAAAKVEAAEKRAAEAEKRAAAAEAKAKGK